MRPNTSDRFRSFEFTRFEWIGETINNILDAGYGRVENDHINADMKESGQIFPQCHYGHLVHGRGSNVKAAAEMPPARRARPLAVAAHITCQTEY